MQSLIIVGGDIQKLKDRAQEICSDNKISKFDIEDFQSEKAVGIGDIRALQKKIFLKPLESEKKAVILQAFLGMTNDSQNAFLKILEEPPENTIIIVLATSLDFFLPTVISRCKVINLEKEKTLTQEELQTNLRILSSLRFPSNALIIAQDFSKDRQTALQFLEGLIITSEQSLNSSFDFTPKDLQKILKDLQKTYTIIKTTNVNVRFALENLFLNLV
jgi:DNA polymerase III gamma/tau subunit